MPPTVARWPRILSEQLAPIPDSLAMALQPAGEAAPREVAATAARALLDGSQLDQDARSQPSWPAWLAPHQVPAAERLTAIIARHGGALLADAVGLGKSYVALAVALARQEPFALVVPAVLTGQWRDLLNRFGQQDVAILTHESLSKSPYRPLPSSTVSYRFFVVDEAHRFRNPETNRYRALARLVVGSKVLLVTATPIHNSTADLLHLLRLFLRDHALAALGVPSLRNAARREADRSLAHAAVARLIVARSRERVQTGYAGGPIAMVFPRATTDALRAAPVAPGLLDELTAGVASLRSGGSAAPLLRLMLLRRLGSSIAAFRAALTRHDAYLDLASRAAHEGRSLTPREFQRCFPRAAESDIQLVLFPLVLEQSSARSAVVARDRDTLARLRRLIARAGTDDPKADALSQLLTERPAKTIVFTDALPTARYLLQRLGRRRVAAVFGHAGRFAAGEASRLEVLRAFAPRAQGGPPPPAALETEVLIATDLLSEGLNLQDAERVVHYDLPWSPARLAQRVGRINRLGSAHESIATVTFLPPHGLAGALAIEERLARKVSAQHVAGADGELDWCDQALKLATGNCAPVGSCAAVAGEGDGAVLIVRIANLVEAIVVEAGVARTNPAAATRMLAETSSGAARSLDRDVLRRAIAAAAPLIRSRLAAVQEARWRASDRDRLARRLIPWVLTAGRRAARRGDGAQLGALDALVSRLALGMTAGEELLLEDLLSRASPLVIADLLAWHERLPAVELHDCDARIELVAALVTSS